MGQALTAAHHTTMNNSHCHSPDPIITSRKFTNFNKKRFETNHSKYNLRFRSGIRFSTIRNNYKSIRKLNRTTNDTVESDKYITNLSTKQLTETQCKVLSKGLKFVPSNKQSCTTLEDSVRQFERSHRLKYHFRDKPSQQPHPFKPKSTWVPPRASVAVESYLQRVHTGITELQPIKFSHNLSKKERTALNELASDTSLVIKSADKGSGIVVEDTTKYIQDGIDHLADETIYREIDSDPTLPLARGINKFVQSIASKGVIDSITKEFLEFKETNMPRTQQLYFLKKIHKNPIAVRPIVSGCGGPTEKISQLIDLQLQPCVPKIKSYIKDSGHMIRLIENLTLPSNCILATIDVKALYLNIPHEEGIKAALNRLYYKNPNVEEVSIPPGTMSDLLKIVLTKNYFQFSDKMYHQIQGTAMGTKMAPAYANLFMAELEETLLDNYPTDPMVWKRYIDDVFCIWPGTKDDLKKFIDYLNRAHHTIKFTYESSETSIDFLDITVYKGEKYARESKLDIKPYFKPTNKFQYLQYSSAHPKSTFSSIIKGELTRLLRNCSQEQEYCKTSTKMAKIFKDRGYPNQLVDRIQNQVPYSARPEIIKSREKEPCKYETFLVTEYTPDLNVRQIKKTIKPTHEEEEYIPAPCLSLKKSKTLSKKLVRAKLKNVDDPIQSMEPITIPVTPNLEGHSAGCGIHGCKCCKAMSRKIRVTSSVNHKSFYTAKYSNCNSRIVIYLLECTKCSKRNQYVGQTKRSLSQRVSGHRAASKLKTNLPLYKHFVTSPDHNFERDTKFSILEKTRDDLLDPRESFWINTLDTVYPKGLNSRYE